MDFAELLREAHEARMSGWDFSAFGARFTERAPSWDFSELIEPHARVAESMLDMGTGGGEFLAGLEWRPSRTIATEGWPPNLPVARERLGPLGIDVIDVPDGTEDTLPLADDSLDLVINRHEFYVPSEVVRILRPGGLFITQQVGGDNMVELNEALGRSKALDDWDCALAAAALRTAGMSILDSGGESNPAYIADIGAVVRYLRLCPWQLDPSYDEDRSGYEPALRELHARMLDEDGLRLSSDRFYVIARAPE